MGNRERQEREREAVRRAILDAARTLFVEHGYENVSLRGIAERIEYSAAAIYSYFPSKDAIFHALAEEGFRTLNRVLDRVMEGGNQPLDVLRRGFLSYYEFSKMQPEYFRLMFVDRSVPRISDDCNRFGFVQEAYEKAATQIRRCVATGELHESTDPAVAFHILWATVHGAAVIRLSNLIDPREDPDALARDTFEAALTGFRTGFPTTFVAAVPSCRPVNDALPSGAPDDHR